MHIIVINYNKYQTIIMCKYRFAYYQYYVICSKYLSRKKLFAASLFIVLNLLITEHIYMKKKETEFALFQILYLGG